MDHNTDTSYGGATAFMSIFSLFLAHVGIGDVAYGFGIMSGAASIFINWPKIKRRTLEIKDKYFKKVKK
jgi:hypothetical protein